MESWPLRNNNNNNFSPSYQQQFSSPPPPPQMFQQPPPHPIHLDKALADLLLSWYQSGYQAGRYHALREVNGGINNNMNGSYHQ